jgi:hypothetical protein
MWLLYYNLTSSFHRSSPSCIYSIVGATRTQHLSVGDFFRISSRPFQRCFYLILSMCWSGFFYLFFFTYTLFSCFFHFLLFIVLILLAVILLYSYPSLQFHRSLTIKFTVYLLSQFHPFSPLWNHAIFWNPPKDHFEPLFCFSRQ